MGLNLMLCSCFGVLRGDSPTDLSLPRDLLLCGGAGALGRDGRSGGCSTSGYDSFFVVTSIIGGIGRGGAISYCCSFFAAICVSKSVAIRCCSSSAFDMNCCS